jgi:hypothetical protein
MKCIVGIWIVLLLTVSVCAGSDIRSRDNPSLPVPLATGDTVVVVKKGSYCAAVYSYDAEDKIWCFEYWLDNPKHSSIQDKVYSSPSSVSSSKRLYITYTFFRKGEGIHWGYVITSRRTDLTSEKGLESTIKWIKDYLKADMVFIQAYWKLNP